MTSLTVSSGIEEEVSVHCPPPFPSRCEEWLLPGSLKLTLLQSLWLPADTTWVHVPGGQGSQATGRQGGHSRPVTSGVGVQKRKPVGPPIQTRYLCDTEALSFVGVHFQMWMMWEAAPGGVSVPSGPS